MCKISIESKKHPKIGDLAGANLFKKQTKY